MYTDIVPHAFSSNYAGIKSLGCEGDFHWGLTHAVAFTGGSCLRAAGRLPRPATFPLFAAHLPLHSSGISLTLTTAVSGSAVILQLALTFKVRQVEVSQRVPCCACCAAARPKRHSQPWSTSAKRGCDFKGSLPPFYAFQVEYASFEQEAQTQPGLLPPPWSGETPALGNLPYCPPRLASIGHFGKGWTVTRVDVTMGADPDVPGAADAVHRTSDDRTADPAGGRLRSCSWPPPPRSSNLRVEHAVWRTTSRGSGGDTLCLSCTLAWERPGDYDEKVHFHTVVHSSRPW